MNRRIRRWLSILLLGALGFTQASLVLAACAMDRSALAQALSVPAEHEGCPESDALPMSASTCLSHMTSDLQAFGGQVPVALAPRDVMVLRVPSPASRGVALPLPLPAKTVPPRILLHSFLI